MAPLSKLQRDQVDQQAQQQQVKQRKAVNAVKKLTKSVYERINPVVDSRSPHPDLLPKDKGQTPNLPLPMGEGWGEGASSIKNLPALPDETIQSNQRLADSIKRRINVGDLPRFKRMPSTPTQPKPSLRSLTLSTTSKTRHKHGSLINEPCKASRQRTSDDWSKTMPSACLVVKIKTAKQANRKTII